MKLRLASAIAVTMTLLAFPAGAEDRAPSSILNADQSSLQSFDVSEATRLLKQLYRKGTEALADHVEVQGGVQPNRQGERRGHLSLKLYPKGKSQSEEGITAETWFGFGKTPEEDRLYFDFKFSKDNKPTFAPHDYI